MATSDAVEVAVEIIDGFSDELTKLEARLEKIDGKTLNVELEIDAGDIEVVNTRLETLERRLGSSLDIDVHGFLAAMGKKKALEGDMHSTLHLLLDDDTLRKFDGNLPGFNGIGPPKTDGGLTKNQQDAMSDFMGSIQDFTRRGRIFERPGSRFGNIVAAQKDIDWDLFTTGRGGGKFPWSPKTRFLRRLKADVSEFTDGKAANPFKNLGQSVKDMMPTMHKWWQLIALSIPVLITMAGAALGAAAAVGALAAAGASMFGIGILGYGDSMAQSLNNFKRDLGQMKKELAGVLGPVGDVFQPFTAGTLDRLPHLVSRLVDPLQRLDEVGYDLFFFEAMDGAAGFMADLISLASELAPEIQAIGWALGEAFGRTLLNILQWSVEELYNNWSAFASLARIIGHVVVVLYNVSKAVSFALTVFEPLFALAAQFTDMIGNRTVAALLAMVGTMVALGYAMNFVAMKMAVIKGMAIAQMFWTAMTATTGFMATLGGLSAVLTTIIGQLTAINILTGGVLLLAGLVAGVAAYNHMKNQRPASGSSGYTAPASRTGFGGDGGGTQINIYGNVGNREYQRLRDEFPDLYGEQRTIEQERQR